MALPPIDDLIHYDILPLVEEYKRGERVPHLAKLHCMSAAGIRYRLLLGGIEPQARGRKLRPSSVWTVLECLRKGGNANEAAAEAEVSTRTAYAIAHELWEYHNNAN